jgi:DNA-binding protein HU-beta
MKKHDLVKAIAADVEVTQEQANKLLDAVTTNITNALARGEDVVLVGFGSFSVKERAARMGRNPKTGEAIPIAASKLPQFKAGKGLKDAIV